MGTLDPALVLALIDTGNQGLIILDADLRVEDLNPWMIAQLTRTPKTARFLKANHNTKPSLREIFPDLNTSIVELIQTCLETRQPRLLTPGFHHPIFPLPGQGPGGWMQQSVRLVPFQESRGMAILITDITEQLAYEHSLERLVAERTAELAAAEHFQRAVLNSLGEAVVITDPEGHILRWQGAAERIYGWSETEVKGLSFWASLNTLFENTHEDLAGIQKHLNQHSYWRGTVMQTRKDGQQIHVELVATPLPTDIQPTGGMIFVGRDISAEKSLQAMLARLEQINRTISSQLSLQRLFQQLPFWLQEVFPFDLLSVALFNPQEHACNLYLLYPQTNSSPQKNIVPLSGTPLAVIRKTEEPLLSTQPENWQFAPEQEERYRSLLALPLDFGGEIIGALHIASKEEGAFERQHIELLEHTTAQLAIAIASAQLFEENRQMAEQLQALSHKVLLAQEEERAHIARELHDHIGQQLTALRLNLQQGIAMLKNVQLEPKSASLVALLEESAALTAQLLNQVRAISLDLRPAILDDLGLLPALRWMLERTGRAAKLKVHLDAPETFTRLPKTAETALFRIAQEACTNIQRHARAKNIWLRLSRHGELVKLHIRDDGIGFNIAEQHTTASLGLRNMRERAVQIGGHMEIRSAPGKGTHISLTYKLHHRKEENKTL